MGNDMLCKTVVDMDILGSSIWSCDATQDRSNALHPTLCVCVSEHAWVLQHDEKGKSDHSLVQECTTT